MGKENKYKESIIRKVLSDIGLIVNVDEFIEAMNKELEIEKLEAKRIQDEEDSKICVEIVLENLVDGEDIRTRIERYFKEESGYKDGFYGDDLPDEGVSVDDFVMVGDKLFKLKVHCSAEWCGDWSLRCNLPDEITVTSITQIKKFDVIENKSDYIMVKI
jgi:hypothetical protein